VHQASQIVASAIAIFDIDGVVRDVGGSYRRALADTVEQFTKGAYRPSMEDIDQLKKEGCWNNDWEASQEMVYRYFEAQGRSRHDLNLSYETLVAFFQSRYRGSDPHHWTGYICQEPLLMQAPYLEQLTQAGVPWGFFSGATRGSASYVLEKRLGLETPPLVAMEDAPGKPDPTGLMDVIRLLEARHRLPLNLPVLYAGDTVADMQTVVRAQEQYPSRLWIGVGILPPHAQHPSDYAAAYGETLQQAGSTIVLNNIEQLHPVQISQLLAL
jgi:HAD superfamily phosphatase